MIELTKVQLQKSITKLIQNNDGFNSVLQMALNALMLNEREHFLSNNTNKKSKKNNTKNTNKANGYRKTFAVGMGKQIQLQIPRDRLGAFKPVVLAIIREQKHMIEDLSFELYGNGLTTRQIGNIMEKIYGKYYSKSAISNITSTFYDQMEQWRQRPLEQCYLAIYIDALHLNIRRETVSNESFYVLMGVKKDYTREIIAIVNIPIESATGWKHVLEHIKKRGVKKIGLIVLDNLKGLDQVIPTVFKGVKHQKCVVHLKRNILSKIASKHKSEVSSDLEKVFDLDMIDDNINKAISRLNVFYTKWGKYYKWMLRAKEQSSNELYFTYTMFHYKIRRMIYTTNWIERLNKEFRRTFKIRNSMPSSESALTLLSKVAMDKEDGYMKYPIYNFKFDEYLNNLT